MATTQIGVERRAQDRLWIGGEWSDATSGGTFATYNPSTGAELTQVAAGDAADIDRAVAAARQAFEHPSWSRMDAAKRGEILWRMADIIEARASELARIETLDNGKPLREAQIDVATVIDAFRYYAGWATKLEGETIPVRGNMLNYTLREPLGVVGAIIPWNFPLVMASWKVAPALACGNTIVLKPAEQTPLTALELAVIGQEAGLPPGVLNVVTGLGETAGAALVAHPDVDKIAFTGSTQVGKLIMREAASTLKKVSLELGGKSPNIVLDDADLDAAVRGAFAGIFYNNGQCCTAGSRLLVHESVHDALLEKLVERASFMQPGEPLDPKRRMGPVISEEQLERVIGYIQKGRAEGAELVTGGERLQYENGWWVQPTVFRGVTEQQTIAQEEIFGPVLATIPFSDDDEAIAIANRSMYGLAAGVWTSNVKRAHRFARALQAGTVWINTYHPLDAASPFGGYKQSGFGRELGGHALELYTQVKSVWVDLS
ncbi:MAG: aldehyde dehydrogenase family protein [Candidatus Cloacimonetes bacterium]|jgi:acyl-CoA reductase-like NAD-dependent aldehyde dehydrogenase|nr:aldehyde dehydrogenase family protein [Candidatus Cloacimonadota bacterium]